MLQVERGRERSVFLFVTIVGRATSCGLVYKSLEKVRGNHRSDFIFSSSITVNATRTAFTESRGGRVQLPVQAPI